MACLCNEGWICERHPDQPWPHDDCAGPGMPCARPECPYQVAATLDRRYRPTAIMTIVADTLRTLMGATAADPYIKAIERNVAAARATEE